MQRSAGEASGPARSAPPPPSSPAPVDGRAARALRTRHAIVDACVAMIEEGDLRPTAPRVAQRAGVSVRSVFQHFEDLPALHTAVTQRVAERLAGLMAPTDVSLPTHERVTAFVGQRFALLEALTPFRHAAQVHGPFSPQIQDALALGTDYLRAEVEQAFAPELDACEPSERPVLLDALCAAASWGMWDTLRTELGVSPPAAVVTVIRILRALLGV